MGTKLDTYRTCAKIAGVLDVIICVLKIVGALVGICTSNLLTSGEYKKELVSLLIFNILSFYLFQLIVAARLIYVAKEDYEPKIAWSIAHFWAHASTGSVVLHLLIIYFYFTLTLVYWILLLGIAALYIPPVLTVFCYMHQIKLVHGTDAAPSLNPFVVLAHVFAMKK